MKKVDGMLYFSPQYKFSDLRWDDKENLINAFRDRVRGFYLEPALKLNHEKFGFATGALCITTVDFLQELRLDCSMEWVKDLKDF